MKNLCTPCLFSGHRNESIATCTRCSEWPVCRYHELSAAGNGFAPLREGRVEAMTPEEAVKILKLLEGRKCSHS